LKLTVVILKRRPMQKKNVASSSLAQQKNVITKHEHGHCTGREVIGEEYYVHFLLPGLPDD
jgi:hypothetical protein